MTEPATNDERTRFSKVPFPADADPGTAKGLEIFVNGIKQEAGTDFEIDDEAREIVFFKPVRKESRIGWWRWLRLFLGIAGSYKQNDSVDVVCSVDGRLVHHVNLPIEVLIEPDEQQGHVFKGSYSPGG